MRIRPIPLETDAPYFPFPLQPSDTDDHYFTTNHLLDQPVRLNRQAAEVLRLADGETRLKDITAKITEHYGDGEGADAIQSRIDNLLRFLSRKELIWWRREVMKPMPVSPPPAIFWEITSACNLQCRHCVVEAGEKLAGELSTERCLEVAEEMAVFGVENVAFSGGEPLLHPDFFRIVERVVELGMTVQVATNGTLVTPQIARTLRDLGAEVQVSLDGSRPEIHDYMRPGRHAFTRTIEGIRALVAAGHEIMIGTVLTTININDIPNILALAESLGAAHFRLIPFVPKGRGGNYSEMEVSTTEVKRITQHLLSLRDKVHINITKLEFEQMLIGKASDAQLNTSGRLGCGGALSYGTITPSGAVLPCHFFHGVRADTIVSSPFAEVWKRSRFLNYFRHLTVADLHGHCSNCDWLPACGGSCRAVNFAKGDIFGTNPQCWIARELDGG